MLLRLSGVLEGCGGGGKGEFHEVYQASSGDIVFSREDKQLFWRTVEEVDGEVPRAWLDGLQIGKEAENVDKGAVSPVFEAGLEKAADSWKQKGGRRNGGYTTGRVCVTPGRDRRCDSTRGERREAIGHRGKESGNQIRSWHILELI